MKSRYLFFSLLAMSMFLFACTPQDPNTEVTCEDFQEVNHRTTDIEVKLGDDFEMTLCSNLTTGFQWSNADISPKGIVEQIGYEFVPADGVALPPSADGRPLAAGAAGVEVWRFKAFAVGESAISVEYSQHWDGGQKRIWTFVLNVTVE